MIITDLDKPLAAEDARKISINNRDDSPERAQFREIMELVRGAASVGHTRLQSYAATKEGSYSEAVQSALRALGYKVVQKRAYKWDNEAKEYSDKPVLSSDGREMFFVEIMWG